MSTRTPVLFRMDPKAEGGECFALFPTLPGSPGFCTSYQHQGQHGSAAYYACIRRSRPATAAERKPLAAELRRIGYRYRIIKRATYAMHQECRKAQDARP